MNHTIITSAVAIALTASFASAGNSYVVVEEPQLGLSGDISVAYQSQYEFRGLTGIPNDYADLFDNDSDVIIGDVNAAYGFTEAWSMVAGFRMDSGRSELLGDQENTYVGAIWSNDCYSVGLGYRYLSFNNFADVSAGKNYSSEIDLSVGAVCPWTGAKLNLLWAHGLQSYGDYVAFSGVKTWEINDWASIDLSAGISYSWDAWDKDNYVKSGNSSNWNSWNIGLAAPLKANEYLTVTPYVYYTDGMSALDFGTYGNFDASEDGEFIWGVKASVNF